MTAKLLQDNEILATDTPEELAVKMCALLRVHPADHVMDFVVGVMRLQFENGRLSGLAESITAVPNHPSLNGKL